MDQASISKGLINHKHIGMKKSIQFLFLSLIIILTFNCQKELSGVNNRIDQSPRATLPITATLQGTITNETGTPAAGASIRVGNKTTITDAKGYFRITNASLDKNASVVTAEMPGYFKAYRVFSATSGANHIAIKLIKKNLAGTIPSSGGTATLTDGTKIALPANSVVYKNGGAPYSGNINVFATYIDPTSSDISQTVPGSFVADDINNKRVILSSYGMLAVELETGSGDKLQIATTSAAVLTVPVPASLRSSAPANIPLWYMDEQTGIWKEEGAATRTGDVYTGSVRHFSFWNCDISVPVVTLSLTLKSKEGSPLVHALVRIKRTVWGGSYGYTDSLGQVSGLVPSNENLELEVLDPCNNPIYSTNIGPFTQNASLGVLSVNITTASLVTIRGKLVNCSNGIVSNGTAIIYLDNSQRYVSTNNMGEFDATFTRCGSAPVVFDVTGINNTDQQQGAVSGVNLVSPVTNIGTVLACGTSALQFINYTLDGNNFVLSSVTASDSLMFYNPTQAGTIIENVINGYGGSGNKNISLKFTTPGKVTGVFPINSLSVQTIQNTQLIQPFNVTVTKYPQTLGEFVEGNFSGSFKDLGNLTLTHTINASFRIRK